ELIVADDGSGPATREEIDHYIAGTHSPAIHVRQEHEGFRLTRLRNLAIARATGDYIVFADGDMLLHAAFVADHRRLAREGTFTQGVRIHLDAPLTSRLIGNPGLIPRRGEAGQGGLRRLYSHHSRAWSRRMRTLANGFIAIKGCNQGFWREDLVKVNGF